MTATLLCRISKQASASNVGEGAELQLHPSLSEPKPRLPLNTTEEPSADRC